MIAAWMGTPWSAVPTLAMTPVVRLGPWVFEDPMWLLLCLLIPIAVGYRRKRGAPAIRFAPGGAGRSGDRSSTEAASPSLRARLAILPPLLHVAGLIAVAVALARPQDRTPLPRVAAGIDILLCVDRSSSMHEQDMDDTRDRLEVARAAALRFIAARPHDRIGLVSFARYTDVLCPPTRDHEALGAFVSGLQLVERNSKEDMTAIGAAIALSARVLRGSDARSKVVILLTDGEENVASEDQPDEIGPLPAAQLCEAFGIRVYTIAAGKDRRDAAGKVVPLDTEQVREVARRTGGVFLEAKDAGGLDQVYSTIDGLETVRFQDPEYKIEDRFRAVLMLALGLISIGALLRLLGLDVAP